MAKYKVRLWIDPLIVDATNEDEARSEALQAIVESPDLLVVEVLEDDQGIAPDYAESAE